MAYKGDLPQVTWEQTRAFRMQRMHLIDPLGARSLVKLTSNLGGIQAQVHSAAELQAAVRLDGLAPGVVERAIYKNRTLVKTWMMRGTIHYLAAADLPVWAAASATRRTWNKPYWQKAFGIAEKDVRLAIEIIPQVLDGACLTREEIADEVHRVTKNAALDELMRAGWGSVLKIVAAEGLLCFGPSKGRNVTFVRPDQWLEDWTEMPPTEEAMSEILRRYLASHGPATREEFARWWGFQPADATKAINALEGELVGVDRDGDKAYLLRKNLKAVMAAEEDTEVRMLGMFDAYTLAGLPHDAIVPKARKGEVYRAGAWVSQVVLRGGRVVGVWTHERKPKGTAVEVKLFDRKAATRPKIERALEQLRPFIGEGPVSVA